MAFPDYAYDLFEDFEDALAGWTEDDTAGKLDPLDNTAEYAGTYGMSVLWDNAAIALIQRDIGSDKTNISVGFWFYGQALGAFSAGGPVFRCDDLILTTGNYVLKCHWHRSVDNTYMLALEGTGALQHTGTLSVSTWYWITIDVDRNNTSTLRVYDTAHSQVGVDVTTTARDFAIRHIGFGKINTISDGSSAGFMDNIVSDWTDATFPLLGWETGGLTWTTHTHRTLVFG